MRRIFPLGVRRRHGHVRPLEAAEGGRRLEPDDHRAPLAGVEHVHREREEAGGSGLAGREVVGRLVGDGHEQRLRASGCVIVTVRFVKLPNGWRPNFRWWGETARIDPPAWAADGTASTASAANPVATSLASPAVRAVRHSPTPPEPVISILRPSRRRSTAGGFTTNYPGLTAARMADTGIAAGMCLTLARQEPTRARGALHSHLHRSITGTGAAIRPRPSAHEPAPSQTGSTEQPFEVDELFFSCDGPGRASSRAGTASLSASPATAATSSSGARTTSCAIPTCHAPCSMSSGTTSKRGARLRRTSRTSPEREPLLGGRDGGADRGRRLPVGADQADRRDPRRCRAGLRPGAGPGARAGSRRDAAKEVVAAGVELLVDLIGKAGFSSYDELMRHFLPAELAQRDAAARIRPGRRALGHRRRLPRAQACARPGVRAARPLLRSSSADSTARLSISLRWPRAPGSRP